jgi:hypothetical protein
MSQTVYIIGAGLNQAIKDWDGFSPPMSRDFFKVALNIQKGGLSRGYSLRLREVYEYIQRYWKMDEYQLASSPFDLEECFTFLESQEDDASDRGDMKEYNRLAIIEFRLKSLLAEVLSKFDVFASTSDTMRRLGETLYQEKPTILTFNYDCIEAAIESGSHINDSIPEEANRPPPEGWPFEKIPVSDNELPYSHFNWNRPLGYGFAFDTVQLQRAGLSTYVEGSRFYSHPQNKLYPWQVLKLHGSLNWFSYLPIRKFPYSMGETPPQLGNLVDQVILVNAHWWITEPPDLDGWIIDPLIVTPVLYKAKFYRQAVFRRIWSKAWDALSKCKRLVVIGYSFSPTDFSTTRLLREALADNDIESLTVVNPDSAVADKARELCHFGKKPAIHQDLNEFIERT